MMSIHSNGRGAVLRRTATVAVLLAGLVLVAAGCGGGSSKSSDSISDAISGAVGGDFSKCADFSQKFAEATSAATPSGGDEDIAALAKNLDSMTSSVPSEVRDDWKVYVDFFKKYASAMNGVDLDNMGTDPAAMQKMSDALSTLNDTKYQTAIGNLSNYFMSGCTKK